MKASTKCRRWTGQCPEPLDPPSSHCFDGYPDDRRYSIIASPRCPDSVAGDCGGGGGDGGSSGGGGGSNGNNGLQTAEQHYHGSDENDE